MTKQELEAALLLCPFCKTGVVQLHENWPTPTMGGGNKSPVSVDIVHHCSPNGLPRLRINITGRDKQEAIDKWNTRAEPEGPSRESLIAVLYPDGVKHPNQAEPDAIINAIRTLIRERDDYRTKYFHKITEPVKP